MSMKYVDSQRQHGKIDPDAHQTDGIKQYDTFRPAPSSRTENELYRQKVIDARCDKKGDRAGDQIVKTDGVKQQRKQTPVDKGASAAHDEVFLRCYPYIGFEKDRNFCRTKASQLPFFLRRGA